jgi:hypothetical protein
MYDKEITNEQFFSKVSIDMLWGRLDLLEHVHGKDGTQQVLAIATGPSFGSLLSIVTFYTGNHIYNFHHSS